MSTAVDTKGVSRRSVHFGTIDELLADVDSIVAADQAGTLKCSGNWTPGQIMGHVAAWINYGFEGYPMRPPPWIIRVILRWMVKKYLRNGMPAGVRIPGAESGTYGVEPLSTAEGAERLRQALRLSYDDRIALNLRHAELHLSLLHY